MPIVQAAREIIGGLERVVFMRFSSAYMLEFQMKF